MENIRLSNKLIRTYFLKNLIITSKKNYIISRKAFTTGKDKEIREISIEDQSYHNMIELKSENTNKLKTIQLNARDLQIKENLNKNEIIEEVNQVKRN